MNMEPGIRLKGWDVELIVYRDETGFDALRDEWNALLGRSRFDTIFLTWEWQSTWWRHLGAQRGPLYLLAAREAGRLIGILPLYLSQADGVHCLTVVGCVEVSDYLDLIIEAGQEDVVYDAFLSWLMGPEAPAWDVAELCNQPAASLAYTRLAELARGRGLRVDVMQEDVCPVITLPRPATAKMAGRSTWPRWTRSSATKSGGSCAASSVRRPTQRSASCAAALSCPRPWRALLPSIGSAGPTSTRS